MGKQIFNTDVCINEEHKIVHLKFSGSINVDFSEIFGELLDKTLNDGHGRILIDFKDVELITSNGLRVLLVFAKKAKKSNCNFAICNMQAGVQRVFTMSGFNEIFKIVSDHEEGISTLKGS